MSVSGDRMSCGIDEEAHLLLVELVFLPLDDNTYDEVHQSDKGQGIDESGQCRRIPWMTDADGEDGRFGIGCTTINGTHLDDIFVGLQIGEGDGILPLARTLPSAAINAIFVDNVVNIAVVEH